MIHYDEPGRHVALTEDEAIARAKQMAALKGHTYPNDQEALMDFIVVHWAEQTEE